MVYIMWDMTLVYSFGGTSYLSLHGLSSSREVYNSEREPKFIVLSSNSIRNIIFHMLGNAVEFYFGILTIICKCFFQSSMSQVMRLKNALITLSTNISVISVVAKVKQSRYRPGVAQRVPGS